MTTPNVLLRYPKAVKIKRNLVRIHRQRAPQSSAPSNAAAVAAADVEGSEAATGGDSAAEAGRPVPYEPHHLWANRPEEKKFWNSNIIRAAVKSRQRGPAEKKSWDSNMQRAAVKSRQMGATRARAQRSQSGGQ